MNVRTLTDDEIADVFGGNVNLCWQCHNETYCTPTMCTVVQVCQWVTCS